MLITSYCFTLWYGNLVFDYENDTPLGALLNKKNVNTYLVVLGTSVNGTMIFRVPSLSYGFNFTICDTRHLKLNDN